MRHVLVLCLITLAGFACRKSPPDSSYAFHKDHISQEQLLQDERTMENTRGVTRVTTTHHHDGAATLEVVVEEEDRMAVQQKLSAMGYVRGKH